MLFSCNRPLQENNFAVIYEVARSLLHWRQSIKHWAKFFDHRTSNYRSIYMFLDRMHSERNIVCTEDIVILFWWFYCSCWEVINDVWVLFPKEKQRRWMFFEKEECKSEIIIWWLLHFLSLLLYTLSLHSLHFYISQRALEDGTLLSPIMVFLEHSSTRYGCLQHSITNPSNQHWVVHNK